VNSRKGGGVLCWMINHLITRDPITSRNPAESYLMRGARIVGEKSLNTLNKGMRIIEGKPKKSGNSVLILM